MYSASKVELLRHGPQNAVQLEVGKTLLQLRPLGFTEEQLVVFEKALIETQVDIVAYLFSLIDQGAADVRWPEELRLVNFDTNEFLCPGRLAWAFNEELLDYQEKNK
jgi:hypothetical protein